MISTSHLHNFQILPQRPQNSYPPHPREGGPPGKVSEICAAGHAPLSSGPLGVRWPSRPTGHIPLASGSAVWPAACPRVNQTCDTRRSCSGQSSGNKPQGSPGEPLCLSGFRQLGSRWSCHLLLWQKAVLKRVAKWMNLCLFSIKFCYSNLLSWAEHQNPIVQGKGKWAMDGNLIDTGGSALSFCESTFVTEAVNSVRLIPRIWNALSHGHGLWLVLVSAPLQADRMYRKTYFHATLRLLQQHACERRH